ncbi:MAG: ATP-binding protein, partial [Bauldia sp.]|nr:ATP-binding protein [Bauldia sp.]
MNAPKSGPAGPDLDRPDLGRVTAISGSGAMARLFKETQAATVEEALTIGRLIGISVGPSLIVGVVARMSVSPPPADDAESGVVVAEIDFMGEIRNYGAKDTKDTSFQRGISSYPTIGNPVSRLGTGDVAVIHHIDGGETIEVGRLKLDPTVPAYINFEEMLRKHFAVLGTTAVDLPTPV